MTRIKWDETGSRLYETGTKMGVIYLEDTNGTYPKGVAWSGLTGVTESPSGADESKIYADDMIYLSLRAAEEFGGTVTAYMYPEEFAECNGEVEYAKGVYIGQQTRKPFGLCYRTVLGNDTEKNDYGYKLHIVYNATVSPSSRDYKTINNDPEAIEFSWEFATTPIVVDGVKPVAHLEINSKTADPTKLAALEDILYGTTDEQNPANSTEARLPLPAEILTIMGAPTGH